MAGVLDTLSGGAGRVEVAVGGNTRAPARANVSAIAAPMPDPAPVMRATLSERLNIRLSGTFPPARHHTSGRAFPFQATRPTIFKMAPIRVSFKAPMRISIRSIALAALFCAACSGGRTGDAGNMTIAVIPKGTTHVFWQSIHAGAEKAAQELGVTVAFRGPLREDDRDSQVTEVENAVARGVAGIALAPLDDSALVGPVSSAMKRGIPVVIFDSGLKGEDYVSFVATDNDVGGRLAGEHMAKLVGPKGRIVMLRYAEGHDSTTRREEGFLAAIREHAGIQIVSANQYGGADVEGFYKKGEALLSSLKTPDGKLPIDGLFTPNESSTLAMLRVLQDNGWAEQVRFIGFDASDTLVKGLRDGDIHGLVVQDPVNMGYLAVKTLVSHIRGQQVQRRIDTGVRLVTAEMMDQPDVKELLQPDLSKWLK
jgi:ribose transport system substrate-binding protein